MGQFIGSIWEAGGAAKSEWGFTPQAYLRAGLCACTRKGLGNGAGSGLRRHSGSRGPGFSFKGD